MSQILRWKLGLVVLATAFCLIAAPLLAEDKIDFVEKFRAGSLELGVATYGPKDRVGLLGLRDGSQENSFAFSPEEWQTFIDLVAKAASQSTGSNWSVVGDMTETNTRDVSRLIISAGPGIRFAVNSPKGPSLTFVIGDSDISRLQQALSKVRAYLAAK
jgi:hypothetical protein